MGGPFAGTPPRVLLPELDIRYPRLHVTPLLVTGLTGFVGSYLAGQEGVFDLCVDGRLADLRVAGEVEAAVAAVQPQAVIHLAAQSSVGISLEDPRQTFDVNFGGTLNLLGALRANLRSMKSPRTALGPEPSMSSATRSRKKNRCARRSRFAASASRRKWCR